ncbi:DUF924 family protein [Vulgatibacter sp.]|uniref:DUF924 family protein n=1 Tax=Vulgatibacter sp. TaxID=1971226 RepID=UPI003561ACA0
MERSEEVARERSEEILRYWFGDEGGDGWSIPAGKQAFWFGKDDAVDAEMRRRFLYDMERAAAGLLRDWARTPRGSLALVILLDQMPRNIHRGTPAAFAHDGQALALVRDGIEQGFDRQLRPVERAFYYLPFEHAEDRAAQAEGVRLYEALEAAAPPDARERFHVFTDFAVRHREIVDRFGRFPHRNQILGRQSSDEEKAFLQQPGSSF